MEIKNKVAIITGAASGIGLATAKLLHSKGVHVVLVDKAEENLKNLSKELPESFAIVTDLRSEEELKKMIKDTYKQYGRIDILINNAGRGYSALIENIESDKIREIYELNVVAPVLAMKEVIPIMRKQNSGSIVNISSGTAFMVTPEFGAYSSSKRALAGLSLAAREELKKDNIIVSTIYPYITATNFYKDTLDTKNGEMPQLGSDAPPVDSAEHIANLILEAVEKGEAEIFAYDWMKNWNNYKR